MSRVPCFFGCAVDRVHHTNDYQRMEWPGCEQSSVLLWPLQNNKDYFDQGLDEVKLLRYVNAADPGDESGLLRLHDFFYFKVSCHGVILCA